MQIADIKTFSTIDYPGKLACVIFTKGCNFRCPYCHNVNIVDNKEGGIYHEDIFSFLRDRYGKLTGVVISGGEPTIHHGLIDFITKVKEIGYSIKLDTNGTHPVTIAQLVGKKLIDAIGIDFKAPENKFNLLHHMDNRTVMANVMCTLQNLKYFKVPVDVRTTVHKTMLSIDDLKTMKSMLINYGINEWFLQQYNSAEVIDNSYNDVPTYTDKELITIANQLSDDKIKVSTRGIL